MKETINKILNNIPGFRSKKTWKMIIAGFYYLTALTSLSQGLAFFIFILTWPFLIFYLIDFVKQFKNFKKANDGANRERRRFNAAALKFIISIILFCISLSVFSNSAEANKKLTNNVSASEKVSVNTPTPKESTVPESKTPEPTKTPEQKKGQLKVHYIDVGQADSILIQSPSGKNMLIDAGNNPDGNNIVSYLKQQGVNKLDMVVGTHPHEDHIGGMDTVINSFDVGSVYMPKVSSNTKTFEDVLIAIKNKGLKVNTSADGVKLELDADLKIEMLAPNNSSYEDVNNYSAVIKLTYGNNTFLFDGDAENISEKEMLAKGYDLKADVLKVGHHGSSSSTTSGFLDTVNPKYAVISVGKSNDYGHPHKPTMEKLQSKGITVYRTDECSTIVATSDGDNINFNTKPGDYSYNGEGTSVSSNTKTQSQATLQNNNTAPVAPVQQQTPAPPPVQNNNTKTVYYTPSGKSYHYSQSCRTLARSKTILSGTLQDAINSGHSDPCDVCVQ